MSQPLMDITFIQALDDLCTEVHAAALQHRTVTSVRVPRKVYDLVAAVKAKQHLSRGNPLLLLGLDLIADDSVPLGRFRLGG